MSICPPWEGSITTSHIVTQTKKNLLTYQLPLKVLPKQLHLGDIQINSRVNQWNEPADKRKKELITAVLPQKL